MIAIRSTDVFTVGKSRVTIIIDGCVDCGATSSIGAEEAVQHMAVVGDRKRRLTLKRCATCAEKRGATWPREMREKAIQHPPLNPPNIPCAIKATV